MSALAKRLAGLSQQAGIAAPATPARSVVPESAAKRDAMISQLRKLLDLRPKSLTRLAGPIDRTLAGEEIAPGLRYIEAWAPWDRDGDLELEGIGQGRFARERMLAFDTETTGLAGGTGTRAFMIGAADWRDGGLRLRQLYITTLAAETSMLRMFLDWIAQDTVLVSYNGKSYDRPLLSTRLRLARMSDPLVGRDHVDLLHPVRRRYKGVWENCRLSTVERELLGVVREDDLPGSEAPGAWLSYLRGGCGAKLRRVGHHNAQDLRSLAGLLDRLSDPVDETARSIDTSASWKP